MSEAAAARERVMERIRRAVDRADGPAARPDRETTVAERLAAAGARHSPTPEGAQTDGDARLARFEAKLAQSSASSSRLRSLEDLPDALAQQLRDRNLPRAIRMGEEPDFAALDWSGTEVSHGPGRMQEPATLSRAFAGSAETGTIALRSGPKNPVTLTFLGETHFAVVRASEVVAGLDEIWAEVRAAGALPRTVNLVTGPSRSADIGQQLQLGAHGPVALHVFILDG